MSKHAKRWNEPIQDIVTPEEKAAVAIRTAIMEEIKKARTERGLSQRKMEELCGVKQNVISRMEKGETSPQIDTVLKLLASLGKTLYIGDLMSTDNEQEENPTA